jgi:biotin carboxylase
VSKTLRPQTILIIACTFKGTDFIREAHRLGCRIFLITSLKHQHKPWPRECLTDIFFVDEEQDIWNIPNLIKGVSFLARTIHFDKIVPFDDYDLEKAAALREHLRVAGMGDTRVRYFRDKFAMRAKADEDGIPIPEFVHVLNYDRIRAFTSMVAPPWVLKPRSKAAVQGIIPVDSTEQLWEEINRLGDDQSFYLLERFIPGDVFHVEGIVYNFEVLFSKVHQYGTPPMETARSGGLFSSFTVPAGSPEDQQLSALNAAVVKSMGLMHGVTHTEFIRSAQDGRFYFLETSARVGGAHINELVEASTGINLWKEWARIEALAPESRYALPVPHAGHAGLLLTLTSRPSPDLSAFNAPEVCWKRDSDHHAGIIFRDSSAARVKQLMQTYREAFKRDFL